MMRAVVIGDAGAALDEVAKALDGMAEFTVAGILNGRRPVISHVAQIAPAVTVIQEPSWSRLPVALIREARIAAPAAALIVCTADATPSWVADAMNAGATAVLPATVDATSLGRVVLQIVADHDTAVEVQRLRWAA